MKRTCVPYCENLPNGTYIRLLEGIEKKKRKGKVGKCNAFLCKNNKENRDIYKVECKVCVEICFYCKECVKRGAYIERRRKK